MGPFNIFIFESQPYISYLAVLKKTAWITIQEIKVAGIFFFFFFLVTPGSFHYISRGFRILANYFDNLQYIRTLVLVPVTHW